MDVWKMTGCFLIIMKTDGTETIFGIVLEGNEQMAN